MSPEERAEAAGDVAEACERLGELLVAYETPIPAVTAAGQLQGCADIGAYGEMPGLVARIEAAIKGQDPVFLDSCNQCLTVVLCNAVAIERGAF